MTADADVTALRLGLRRFVRTLRYGENPHQTAALYTDDNNRIGAATATQIQGKPLGYNNLIDADAALAIIAEFNPTETAAITIVKHATPCGMAARNNLPDAYAAALQCDPISAFGGVIASNRSIDKNTAQKITRQFTELVIAPHIQPDALQQFQQKPSLRVLETGGLPDNTQSQHSIRSISGGGILVQQTDTQGCNRNTWRQVSIRTPEEHEMHDLRFAFLLCKHVKSNAIVIARDATAIGIGSGQTNRIEAVQQAIRKAQNTTQTNTLQGSVMASDGFFPFPDSIQLAAQAGIRTILQPGGSKRDQEVIKAANDLDIAMLLTGIRQFRH